MEKQPKILCDSEYCMEYMKFMATLFKYYDEYGQVKRIVGCYTLYACDGCGNRSWNYKPA